MIICMNKIYDDESPYVIFIDTEKMKTAGASQDMINYFESLSNQFAASEEVEMELNKYEVNLPCMIEKKIDFFVDYNIDTSFNQWLKKIAKIKSSNVIPQEILDRCFSSTRAELPDGTPMEFGFDNLSGYPAIALKNIVDNASQVCEIQAGEECKVIFMGYSDPNNIGMFFRDYIPNAKMYFRIAEKSCKDVFQDAIFTSGTPVFGVDFALDKLAFKNKVKPKI